MPAHTPGLNPVEGERLSPRTETPYTLNLAFATKDERATAKRLIAAAPALLEALEAASDSVDEDYFLKPSILIKMRAAIKQAKGKTV